MRIRNVILSLVSMIVFSFILINCSKSEKEAVIKPQTTKIKGDLGDYYEVVNKDYKINNDSGMFDVISVSIKRKDGGDVPFDPSKSVPFGTSHVGKDTHVGFGIELFDEDGNSIDVKQATADGLSGVYSSDDIKSMISLKSGEIGTVRWSINKELLSKVKSFVITSAIEHDENISNVGVYSSDDNYTEDMGYSNSNESIDQLLDSYEQYMIEYAQLTKNAQSGSTSGTMESYSELLSKQQDLSDKLNNVRGSMTTEQASRFAKIQANVMSTMGY
ncbi:hypothetical protein EGI16_05790 [Chryseobacterium sp. G0240]|uniref:hypothetical protein n=1 Tax=Chryseobacterium sp. G0240 TaxID=2487066 RepID=UPI000FA44DDE|nr:hypothetical protein [Chryseobacterium sp. G0240]ROI05890.1 hypothetical protein EGI16_05790 [Chryseobacterium sp. G0240]